MGILDILDNPQMLSEALGLSVGPNPPGGGIGSDSARVPNQQQLMRAIPMPLRRPQPQQGTPLVDESGLQTPDYTPPNLGPDPNAGRGAFDYPQGPAGLPNNNAQFSPQPPPGGPGPGPAPGGGDPNATLGTPDYPMGPAAFPNNNAPPPQQPPQVQPQPPGAPGEVQPGGIGSDAARTPGVPVPPWQQPGPAQLPPGALPQTAPVTQSQPAPRPPASQFINPPTGELPPGGLMGALGLTGPGPTIRSAVAGLGKGLSAVGRQPAGTPKGAAFAAGAGGSLEGVTEQENRHSTEMREALKDALAYKKEGDTAGYRQAQVDYLRARARSLNDMTDRGGKPGAWQNTPLGQVAVVEQRVAAFDGPRRKSIDAQVRSGAMTPEQAKPLYDKLEKDVQQFRDNVYRSMGIDPKQGNKMRMSGQDEANPISTKGMTEQQFHDQVPLGAWYETRDKDGKPVIMQRTVPPPGSENQGQPRQRADAESNYDDQTAMTEAT